MKYYHLQSQKNVRGIWVEEREVAETIRYNFPDQKVTKTEISEEQYIAMIKGQY